MSKKLNITFLCIALQCISHAGLYAKKAYLNMQWESCQRSEAVFYYNYSGDEVDGNYQASVYYTDNVLYCTGWFNTEEVSFGARNGSFTYYFHNTNKMCEGTFTNGVQNGWWRIYFPTGLLERAGNYTMGIKTGKWAYYDKYEDVASTVDYLSDDFTGENKIWHQNGALAQDENYNEGKLHGSFVSYFSNGKIDSKGEYDNGKRVGEWLFYYETGKHISLASREIYSKTGKLDSVYFFNPDGSAYKGLIDTAHLDGYIDIPLIHNEISTGLIYPPLAVKKGIHGKVNLSFLVKTTAEVTDLRIEEDIKLDFGIEEECLRVVKTLKNLKPAIVHNRKMDTRYKFPVILRLE